MRKKRQPRDEAAVRKRFLLTGKTIAEANNIYNEYRPNAPSSRSYLHERDSGRVRRQSTTVTVPCDMKNKNRIRVCIMIILISFMLTIGTSSFNDFTS